MVTGGILALIAALIVVLSPLAWTDHFWNGSLNKPLPAGCAMQTTPTYSGGFIVVAHCPFWVQV